MKTLEMVQFVSEMDVKQLRKMNKIVIGRLKDLKAIENLEKKAELYVGAVVTVDHDRLRGEKGIVTKINRTKAECKFPSGNFTIPMNMLEIVEPTEEEE